MVSPLCLFVLQTTRKELSSVITLTYELVMASPEDPPKRGLSLQVISDITYRRQKFCVGVFEVKF